MEVHIDEELFLPHKWQKRYPSDRALEEHVKFITNETETVKKHIRCEFDVPYGFLRREKYNIYGINLPDNSPILIHVHGGYWQVKEINHDNQGFLAAVLHKHNIKVISLGYELCPEVTVKEIINEIQVAIRRCLDYAKRCKSKGVYLSGHSAGAHLVASLFSTFIHTLTTEEQDVIRKVFLSCGLYDAIPLTKTKINNLLNLDEETAKEVSPQHMQISCPKHLKIFVMVAEQDAPAFLKQAEAFYEKLKENDVEVNYRMLKDVDHFNAIEKMTEEHYEATELFINEIC